VSWFDAVVNECLRVDGFQRRAFSLANHRPPLRLRWCDAPPHPDAIRVPSWRQEDGDKRADLRGRLLGDVFDFTRVGGNSKQRQE
jgi:hypothetical protein